MRSSLDVYGSKAMTDWYLWMAEGERVVIAKKLLLGQDETPSRVYLLLLTIVNADSRLEDVRSYVSGR